MTVADKGGFFRFDKPFKTAGKVLLQIRKAGLKNGGIDLFAEPGRYVTAIQGAAIVSFNPMGCRERDALIALINGATRLSSLYEYLQVELEALRKLVTAQGLPRSIQGNELRMQIHSENFLRSMAAIPNVQIRCANEQSGCVKRSLNPQRRQLLHSVKQLRSEALLINRILRIKGGISATSSSKRVASIVRRCTRLQTIVKSLPRFTFTCASAS